MSIYGEALTITIDVNSYTPISYVDTISASRVTKSGNTMSGPLSMKGNKITSICEPTSNQDAASKNYVHTVAALRVSKRGDTMTGPLSMNSNTITNVADPTGSQDVCTKNYVDLLGNPVLLLHQGRFRLQRTVISLCIHCQAERLLIMAKFSFVACGLKEGLRSGLTAIAESSMLFGHCFICLPAALQSLYFSTDTLLDGHEISCYTRLSFHN